MCRSERAQRCQEIEERYGTAGDPSRVWAESMPCNLQVTL